MKVIRNSRQRVLKHSLARKFEAVWLRSARRLAHRLNNWAAGYSKDRQYWVFVLACLLVGSYCLYLIMHSIFKL